VIIVFIVNIIIILVWEIGANAFHIVKGYSLLEYNLQ